MLQPRGLQPARHDGVARVPHPGLTRGPWRLRGRSGGGGGARAAAGEALRPPLGRQLGGWVVGSRESRGVAGGGGSGGGGSQICGRVGNAGAGFEEGELGMGIGGGEG